MSSRQITRALIAFVCIFVTTIPLVASAAVRPAISVVASTAYVPAAGGAVNIRGTFSGTGVCHWSAKPAISGFDEATQCSGQLSRVANIPANAKSSSRKFVFTLVAGGASVGTTAKTVLTQSRANAAGTSSLTTNFPGGKTDNWSGYLVSGGPYTGVGAQWTVPSLNCSALSNASIAVWVGVNGIGNSPQLFQDGTSSSCVAGTEQTYAWWTDKSENLVGQPVFTPAAGDVLRASVTQDASGNWSYSLQDVTSGATSSAEEPFNVSGTTAEWIVEDPTQFGSGLYPLPSFGRLAMSDLSLNSASGDASLPPFKDAIEMVSNGSVAAIPTPIVRSGASSSFVVTSE